MDLLGHTGSQTIMFTNNPRLRVGLCCLYYESPVNLSINQAGRLSPAIIINTMQQKNEESLQAYEKLPIYRKARELLRSAHVITARMDKTYKYTLGQKICNAAQDLAESVFLAYEERDNLDVKLSFIERIKRCNQVLLVNYRIANDLGKISGIKMYGEQVEIIVSIIKQCRGWEQATREQIKCSEV